MYVTSDTNDEPPIHYKSCQIGVSRVGKGWRASIFVPNATRPLADSPFNLEKSEQKAHRGGEANLLIDAHLTRNT